MDYAAIGARIRQARLKALYTQSELSERIGISTSFLGHIERGTIVMSIETLFAVCDALDLSADYLVTGNKKPTF